MLVLLLVGSAAFADGYEYNTTLPTIGNKTLNEGMKSNYVIYAKHGAISSNGISSYTCWIEYAQPNSNSWTKCTNNFTCVVPLPAVPPVTNYINAYYTATPAYGSRTRLRTSTHGSLFSNPWVHGEITY